MVPVKLAKMAAVLVAVAAADWLLDRCHGQGSTLPLRQVQSRPNQQLDRCSREARSKL
jgi:hypothetical protein